MEMIFIKSLAPTPQVSTKTAFLGNSSVWVPNAGPTLSSDFISHFTSRRDHLLHSLALPNVTVEIVGRSANASQSPQSTKRKC